MKRKLAGDEAFEMTLTAPVLAKTAHKQQKNLHFCKPRGADTRIRPGDPILTKMYQNMEK